DHVVAVAQGVDAGIRANLVAGAASDQAVGLGYGAADAGSAVAPRRRASVAVPGGTQDHVVAVRQGGDAAHAITGRGADQAGGGRYCAADAGGAAAPGRRAPARVPTGNHDHVVAVRQIPDADVANGIIYRGADQAVVGRDNAADASRAAAPRRRTPA